MKINPVANVNFKALKPAYKHDTARCVNNYFDTKDLKEAVCETLSAIDAFTTEKGVDFVVSTYNSFPVGNGCVPYLKIAPEQPYTEHCTGYEQAYLAESMFAKIQGADMELKNTPELTEGEKLKALQNFKEKAFKAVDEYSARVTLRPLGELLDLIKPASE